MPRSPPRLASVFHGELTDLYIEAVKDRLARTNLWEQIGAFQLLISLADLEVSVGNLDVDTNGRMTQQWKQQYLLNVGTEAFPDGLPQNWNKFCREWIPSEFGHCFRGWIDSLNL